MGRHDGIGPRRYAARRRAARPVCDQQGRRGRDPDARRWGRVRARRRDARDDPVEDTPRRRHLAARLGTNDLDETIAWWRGERVPIWGVIPERVGIAAGPEARLYRQGLEEYARGPAAHLAPPLIRTSFALRTTVRRGRSRDVDDLDHVGCALPEKERRGFLGHDDLVSCRCRRRRNVLRVGAEADHRASRSHEQPEQAPGAWHRLGS